MIIVKLIFYPELLMPTLLVALEVALLLAFLLFVAMAVDVIEITHFFVKRHKVMGGRF